MRRRNKPIFLALLVSAPIWAQEAAILSPTPPKAATAAPKVDTITPVKDRILVIGALSKRTGQSRSFSLKPGQYVDFAGIRITARSCETTPPWERPKLDGAFLQVDEKLGNSPLRRVFSGWLYAQSPSLNVMEHPRYDVWLKSCTMRFPDGPEVAPSPSSSTKKSPEPANAATS
jgi:hypothetical protein